MSLAAFGCSFLPLLPFAAVCCKLLPAVFCYVILCVAACRYCFRLPVSPAILIPTPWRKWPRSVKIVPKWALNGLENGSVEHLGALGRQCGHQVSQESPLWYLFGPSGAHFGTPKRVKIHPKTRFWQKFAWEEAFFLQFFLPLLFLVRFLFILAHFYSKNQRKNHRAVAHLVVISHPSKTMHFAGCPACSQCF